MEIQDIDFPDDGKVALSQITAKYIQNLDCCQSSEEYSDCCQILTLTTDDGGGGKFIRINTGEAGWSIDDIDQLVDIIKDFQYRYRCG